MFSMDWDHDVKTQWTVQLVYCLLSTLGCCFVIFCFIYLKIRKVHYQYVLCLAISQLILSLNGIVGCIMSKQGIVFEDGSIGCKLQASLLTIGQKSGWMYISLISFNMITLSRGHTEKYMKSKAVWIHIFSWVVINAAFIGGLWTTFGRTLPFAMCWTKEDKLLYALYIPMALFGVFNAGAIIYITVRYIKDLKRNKEVRTNLLTARSDAKVYWFLIRISFYPCIFLLIALCMSFGRFFYNEAEGHGPDWSTYLIQSFFLEGFFSAVAYGFTPSLRMKYAKIYRRLSSTPTLEDAWSTASCMSPPML